MKILNERGYCFTNAHKDIICDIKEKLCYADLTEGISIIQKIYESPDGRTITVGQERFMCIDPLFNPALVGLECKNLPEMIVNSVMGIDICIRNDLLRNICLCGGNTLFPGFCERLEKELNKIIDTETWTKARVIVTDNMSRMETVWIGGSILGSLTTSGTSFWISKEEYDEEGPVIVHKRCF